MKVWSRMHGNGMLAVVHPLQTETNRYAYGALVPGGAGALGELIGFEEAKAAADRVSACAQPCECPPWSE